MNEVQTNWLLETFFKSERYPGWKGIATKLIETGSCIVTKQGADIWIGGIGNFIDTEDFEEGVDLVKLKFDAKEFCSKDNVYFARRHDIELSNSYKELAEMSRRIDDLKNLTNI